MNFDRWVELNNALIEEKAQSGLIALSDTTGIQVNTEAMLHLPMREYTVERRASNVFQYEVSKKYSGTEFFCMIRDQAELSEYIGREHKIAITRR